MRMPVVGLTGGIAAGKSTVARKFAQLGVPVIDADQLARDVVQPGSEGLREIVEAFGSDLLLPDGSLDRKALGDSVFGDPAALRKLNAITHPRIAKLAQARIAEAAQGQAPYVLYEAALLVESGLHRGMDALVVVSLGASAQLRRLMERNGLSESAARTRIASQLPPEQKRKAADFVIDNSGSEQELEARVQEVHDALRARLGRQAP